VNNTISNNPKKIGMDIRRTWRQARGVLEIKAFMIQCIDLPTLWPFARTLFGKTSLMYTHMTAP
jgi:hypothetical protein